MKKFSVVWIVALVLMLVLTSVGLGQELVILHTNDVHGRIYAHTPRGADYPQGGLLRVATLVEEQRAIYGKDKVILLDAGDVIHGTNVANLFGGMPVIDVMNTMGYHAMVLGNHEFNHGQAVLLERMDDANFPILGANIHYSHDGSAFAPAAFIQEINGLRVGIVGLAYQNTPHSTHPKNVEGLFFSDEMQRGAELAQRLRPEVDVLIALSHMGYNLDEQLAWAAPEFDVIIGGHSHTTLEEPTVVRGVIIAHAHEYGNNLGVVRLQVEEGEIVNFNGHLIPVGNDIPEHPVVKAVADEWNELLEGRLNEVVVTTEINWNGEREYVRTQETNLGNLIADKTRIMTGADVAIANGGGIRSSINAGEVTVGDIYTVLAFDNITVVVEVTGQEIIEALEHGSRAYPDQNGGFLQVSGMSYAIDANAPAGSRVKNVHIQGEPIDLDATYTLGTNDFLAAGGDDYHMLNKPPVSEIGDMQRDLMIEYIDEVLGGVLREPEAGRITIIE